MLLEVIGCRRVRFGNLIAICEPIVYKMWEPQHLTTRLASTTCYRDRFTLFFNAVGWYARISRMSTERSLPFSNQRLELLKKGVLCRMLVPIRSFMNIFQLRQVLLKGAHTRRKQG
jgi:hypothetical protein